MIYVSLELVERAMSLVQDSSAAFTVGFWRFHFPHEDARFGN
jgi:hypothetical protein